MPSAHRLGDMGSGHACHFVPSPALGGSTNVLVNSRPAMRVGDQYLPHACPMQCVPGVHPRQLAKGSTSVFINGRPAGRRGDSICCGGQAMTGSSNVNFG
jgi:uncharacterized Zn-binding protein involved in type VI secretion